MQKKKEKLLDKMIKRNYNNELEFILEKKIFDENAKNLLLNILYKIEASYGDYKKTKRHVKTKEEYIQSFINMIEKNCENITICKMTSNEKDILGNKTFLVDKENKRIVCYPIERKLLYCISKISKHDKIIKEEYPIIDKTLSNLINTGNNIDTVETLRDFNGYSWTTISREIESVSYNIVYQNLRILLGYDFLDKWIQNREFIIDYMEVLKNRLDEKYGVKNRKEIIKIIEKLSVLLELKYNPEEKKTYSKEKKEIEEKLDKINDKEFFIKMITEEKRKLTEEIKYIDETINNKELLQEEYIKRNQNLPLEKKIFSVRILAKLMIDEREQKLKEIEKYNDWLNPKKFVEYKKELEEKYAYLKLVSINNLEKEIANGIVKLQKIFLKCYKQKIETIENKSEIIDCIYEFRYYNLLPFDYEININQVKEVQKELKETIEMIVEKAQNLKTIIVTSKNKDIDNEILKNIFHTRIINLEDLYIKIIKEKEKFYIQLFDGEAFEKKSQIETTRILNKKDLEIKINKKIKVFG